MPITAADIVAYGAANHQETDSGAQGGAIDVTKKVAMIPMAADDDVEAVSSDAGDTTQTLTITGRLVNGKIDTEVISLNGTTPAAAGSPKTWNRILKAVLSGSTAGTVTLRRRPGGATIATLESGILQIRTLFYDTISLTTGAVSYYEKFFLKNNHATLALTQAAAKLTADPTGVSDFLMAVEDAIDDNGTSADRKSAPAGITGAGFIQNGVSEAVPGNALGPGEAIGIWLRMDLAQDNAPVIDNWDVTLTGATI